MKCPKCGAENDNGKTVCGQCGTFLYKYTQNRHPMTRQERRKETAGHWKQALRGTIYALLVLAGFALVLFLLALLLGQIIPDSWFEGLIDTTATT